MLQGGTNNFLARYNLCNQIQDFPVSGPCNPRVVPSRSELHLCTQPGWIKALLSQNTNFPPEQAELETHRSGAKKAKAKEGWMNREGGGLVGNSGGGGPPPPVKPEEKEPNRVEEMSKRGTESLVRETKPPINRLSKDPEKLGNSSSLPPREQKLVAAIGPPPVAQVAPIPRVLQVFHVFLKISNSNLSLGPPSNHGAHPTPAVDPNRYPIAPTTHQTTHNS